MDSRVGRWEKKLGNTPECSMNLSDEYNSYNMISSIAWCELELGKFVHFTD